MLGLGTRYYVACFRYLRCYFQLSTYGPSFGVVPSSSAFAMPIVLGVSTVCFATSRQIKLLEGAAELSLVQHANFVLRFEQEVSVSRVVTGFPLLLQHPLSLRLVSGDAVGKISKVLSLEFLSKPECFWCDRSCGRAGLRTR